MTKPHIIYIPGLGDHYDGARRTALRAWRLYGVTAQLIPMQWYGGFSYDQKQAEIDVAITAAIARGQEVILIGESAGGSIATNVFAADKRIARLVTLCGVVYPDASVSPRIYRKSPAFQESMSHLRDSIAHLDRKDNIVNLTALHDAVVSDRLNIIQGAQRFRLPSFGHLTTIALGLTLFASYIIYRATKSHKYVS